MSNSPPMIGIDLGTTNAIVAVFKNGNADVLTNSECKQLTKSVVSFTEREILVGPPAVSKRYSNIKNTVYDAKRLLGKNFDEIQEFANSVEFDIVDDNNQPKIRVSSEGVVKEMRPLEISAIVLKKMRETAELRLKLTKGSITGAVITIPAYFDQAQREDTLEAAVLAGFNETDVHFISEPAAAAYHYGQTISMTNGHNLLVFDFGGGTFDISIIEVCQGRFTVKAIDGDTNLGGRDFDNALAAYVSDQIRLRFGKNIESCPYKRQKLYNKCEELKVILSSTAEEQICMAEFFDDIYENLEVTREDFNRICEPLMKRAIELTLKTLTAALLKPADIDEVLLVGGTTQIPQLKHLLCSAGFNLNGREQIVETEDKELVVARGAAVYAAQLSRMDEDHMPNMELTEVTPLSIGTGKVGKIFRPVIKRNTKLPIVCSKEIYTWRNDQYLMALTVVEGERKIVTKEDFSVIGHCSINQLPKGIIGGVRVDLIMELNKNGMLKVTLRHGVRNVVMEIDRNRNRLPTLGVGEIITNAEIHLPGDIVERNRLLALNQLVRNIQSVKYNQTGKVRTLCKEYEKWIDANRGATKYAYEAKLQQFRKESNPLIKLRI